MRNSDVILFTRFGMGEGPAGLQQALVQKYLGLLLESGSLPSRILFYTDGVRLACQGSPVINLLVQLETQGVELVLCKTCLDTYQINDQVMVGVVGGMADILDSIQNSSRVVSL